MLCSIFTNVGKRKKPWEDVPIEVLIEEERKKEEGRRDHREHLHAPPPIRPDHDDRQAEEESGYKIVIKL